MTPLQFETLVKLHNDRWTDNLIGQEFGFVFDRILSPAERDVTSYKIQGLTLEQICEKKNCKLQTVKRIIYNIQFKYRNFINKRCDDWKPIREHRKRLQNEQTQSNKTDTQTH